MLEGDAAEPVDPDMDVFGHGWITATGKIEIFASRRATADEDGVVVFGEQGLHAFDGRVVANFDAHIEDHVDFIEKDLFGEAEGRDVAAHQAARLIEPFVNGGGVAEGHQVIGDGERCGSAADEGDSFAVFLFGRFRQHVADVTAKVGGDALEAADGDGLIGFETSAAAGWFAGAITGTAEDGGKDVRFAIQHVGIGVSALSDETDVFRDVGVGGASPLAVDYFVVVVGVAGISWLHSTSVETRASSLPQQTSYQYGFWETKIGFREAKCRLVGLSIKTLLATDAYRCTRIKPFPLVGSGRVRPPVRPLVRPMVRVWFAPRFGGMGGFREVIDSVRGDGFGSAIFLFRPLLRIAHALR